MNGLILLAIALCVFVMGHRFYAKLLAVWVFRPPAGVEVPALRHPQARDYGACNRWLLLPYQTVAGAGLLSMTGVGIGVAWGWAPAFLWIVVGTVVAGGTYALAGLWSSLRDGGNSVGGVVFGAAGAWAAVPIFFLGTVLLVLLCAFTAVLLGQLLQSHPESTWLFLSIAAATRAAERAVAAGGGRDLIRAIAAAAALLTLGMVLGQLVPLGIGGGVTLDVGPFGGLRVPPETAWAAAALVLALRSVTSPVASVARPRGILAGALLFFLVLLAVIGLIVSGPLITAPEFNREAGLADPIPLLFLAISAGAVFGACALFAAGPIGRQIERQEDAPTLAFGTALANGALAVLVLIVVCAGFLEPDEWLSVYGSLPADADAFVWLDLVVVKMGRFVAALGVPMHIAVAFVAGVAAGSAQVMLETALRALSFSVEEFAEDFSVEALKGDRRPGRAAAIAVGAAAFVVMQPGLGLNQWMLLGLTNLLFTGALMLVLALVVRRHARGAALVLTPGAALLACGLWGLAWLVLDWWRSGDWLLLAAAVAVGALALAGSAAGLRSFISECRRSALSPSRGAP